MYGIIDVGNWHDILEMETGRSLELPEGSYAGLCELAANALYPGDDTDKSVGWMGDSVEKLLAFRDAQLLTLVYTQPFFNEMYAAEDQSAAAARQKMIFEQINALAKKHDYIPITVLCFGYVPLREEIFQPDTEGVLESWAWGASIAGFSGACAADRALLEKQPHIKKVISAEEILKAHPAVSENFRHYLADYIVAAEDGYAFRGYNSHMPKLYMTDIWEEQLPVSCGLAKQPQRTAELFGIIKEALQSGKRILLSFVEGYDTRRIPEGFRLIDNTEEWYAYRGLDLYLNVMTGKPFYESDYAPVYDRTKQKTATARFPYSGFFESIPQTTLADFAASSGTVSSRSMVMHMATKADISMECYSRDRSQMGVLLTFDPLKFNK